jgi:hypothetical protein
MRLEGLAKLKKSTSQFSQGPCIAADITRPLLAYSAARICLPNRCLTINVYSDFAILAFGRHITICIIYISSQVDNTLHLLSALRNISF